MEMIFLIGFMGSGKSFLGKKVADKLGLSFYDFDIEIENISGMTISEIFEKKGEAYFRELESEILLNWSKSGIITTGGGIVETKKNRSFLKKNQTIWINESWDELYSRIQNSERPLVEILGKEKLEKLYDSRETKYTESAKFYVSSNFEELLALITIMNR